MGAELLPRAVARPSVGAPSLELELSPGFTAYQDGFSRLIASDTTFVTGLAALAGLQRVAEPTSRATTAPSRHCSHPTEQAAWERPDALGRRRCRPWSERLRGSFVPEDASPSAPTRPPFPTVSACISSSRCWRDAGIANDQILRMATAEGALALGLEQQIGTLEEGKLADFVVLDGDPLAHIADTLRIVAVVKGRRLARSSALC